MMILSAVLFSIGGCSVHPFSGSAAMRIDVEVYKGPLSEEPETQWGGLLGDIEEARKGLVETDNLVRAVIANRGFDGVNKKLPSDWPLPRTDVWDRAREQSRMDAYSSIDRLNFRENKEESERLKTDLDAAVDPIANEVHTELEIFRRTIDGLKGPTADQKRQVKKSLKELAFQEQIGRSLERLCRNVEPVGFFNQMQHFDCLIIVTLVSDIRDLLARLSEIRHDSDFEGWFNGKLPAIKDKDIVKQFLTRISLFATECRDKAFRLAIASTAGQSMSWKVRMAVVTTIVAASEYGNQVRSRADGLMKQMDSGGLDRRELPPGVALRDSNPTDFVQLYRWFDAASYSWVSKYWQGIGTVQARTKIVARLFSDHYWSQINTVYASGRGKVSMALIKDDVGNWNLKSFDNDPEELLNAYKDFTITTLRRSAEIAKGVATSGASEGGIIAIKQLMNLANNAAFTDSHGNRKAEIFKGIEKQFLLLLNQKVGDFDREETRLMAELKNSGSLEERTKSVIELRRRHFSDLQKLMQSYSAGVDAVADTLVPYQPTEH
jgi:hypothetical protein